MIVIKNNVQIQKMREAGQIVRDALNMIEAYVRPGISTLELDRLIEAFIIGQGAKPSFKNYNGFPNASCISVNEVVVHGIPSSRVLEEGEIVSIDIGAYTGGFHGDAARTFGVGKISDARTKLIEVTKQSFFEGVKHARAGRRLGDIGHAIQQYAEQHGFGVVREMVGHGVGAKLHEEPNIPNFGSPGTGPLLKAGFTLAIEPMITMGSPRIKIDRQDGWTCSTVDGSDCAHYENTVLITHDEPELLTY